MKEYYVANVTSRRQVSTAKEFICAVMRKMLIFFEALHQHRHRTIALRISIIIKTIPHTIRHRHNKIIGSPVTIVEPVGNNLYKQMYVLN